MPIFQTTGRETCRQLLLSDQTFATTLVAIVVNEYGTEAFEWDPETIKMEINEDFHVQIPTANFDRLMAGIGILTTDDFFQSLPDFVNYCNILSGDSYDPSTFDPADVLEIAWGIFEVLLLTPPEEDNPDPFSLEITAYIGKQLDAEGIITPPDILRIAVRDKDPANMVGGEYSDDPIMFASIYEFEAGKTEDINNAIQSRVQSLMSQLQSLPFNTADIKKSLANIVEQVAN